MSDKVYICKQFLKLMREIERKFLVKKLPDLSKEESINYERYFLKIESDFEERIQKKGDTYEKERKFKTSDLSRKTEKQEISKEDFDVLKKTTSQSIIRDSYKISEISFIINTLLF